MSSRSHGDAATDHGLQVHLGVPVRVVEDDHVGRGQVDTQASCPGAQHEDELAAVGLVVRVDGDLETNRDSIKPKLIASW